MRIFVLIEDGYIDSPWCRKILEGIKEECAKKNYNLSAAQYAEFLKNTGLFMDNIDPPVLVLGYTTDRVLAICQHLRKLGPDFILINCKMPLYYPNAHCILPEFTGALYELYSMLFADGKRHPAMVGANEDIYIEVSKTRAYMSVLEENFQPEKLDGRPINESIYFFRRTVKDCFEDFYADIDLYDSILCANDFVAVYFIRELRRRKKRIPEDIHIAAFIDTNLGRRYAEYITSVSINYDDFGKQLVSMYAYLQKKAKFSPMTVFIDSNIARTNKCTTYPADHIVYNAIPLSPLYQDPEIEKMRAIETLLSKCDEIDHKIIKGLMQGKFYLSIALDSFISESTVKYRVKEMLGNLGLKSRKDLVSMLASYLDHE